MPAAVLVADHDSARLEELSNELEADGYEVIRAASTDDASRIARALRPFAVILELGSDTAAGLAALDDLLGLEDAPSVVLVADDSDVATAVAAMRRGAKSFLVRPVDTAALDDVLRSARLSRRASEILRAGVSGVRGASGAPGEPVLVARSPAMQRVLAQIERIAAAADTTVLVQGESGTGKELVARRIHARSSRSRAPFVPIVCAALCEPQPGSEPSLGALAATAGGTAYFDEIGELPLVLQAKLLEVLQGKSFRSQAALDVRVVASTTRDLEESVAEGSFRADLFYRLNVLAVRVPPLRERAPDLPELAAHFLAAAGAALGRHFQGFADGALERLESCAWPGNVRELENAIVRAATLESSPLVQPHHLGLPAKATRPKSALEDPRANGDVVVPPDRTLRALEQTHIARVLRESRGNRSMAARLLGVNRTTLYAKLRRYGIR